MVYGSPFEVYEELAAMYLSVDGEKVNREEGTVGEGRRALERRSCAVDSCA